MKVIFHKHESVSLTRKHGENREVGSLSSLETLTSPQELKAQRTEKTDKNVDYLKTAIN